MRIAVGVSPGERRTVLLDDAGDPVEYSIERPDRPDGLGDLIRARVTAVAPAMAGAFLALPHGVTGFLPEGELPGQRRPIARAVPEGTVLPVRVSRPAQGGKGPRVTARLTEAETAIDAAASPGQPLLLRQGDPAAIVLAHAHPHALVTTDAAAVAAALRGVLGADRVTLVPRAFDPALEELLDALAEPEAPLPGGGRLLIHPTPALVAIDIDAGLQGGARDAAGTARFNAAAMTAVARQIRLRALSGAILIDPAGLVRSGREALLAPLASALAGDRAAKLLGLGPLGLIELVRARRAIPLHEILGSPPSVHTQALHAARRLAREAQARPGPPPPLRAPPPVLAAFDTLPIARAELAMALGGAPALLPE